MIAIGILLVLAATGTAAMAATGGDTPTQITFGAFRVENTTGFFFFSGALCAAVLLIGAWTIWRGYLRWRDRGRELQELRMRAAEADAEPANDVASRPRGYQVDTGTASDTVPVPTSASEPEDSSDFFDDRPVRRSRRHRTSTDSAGASSEAGVPG